MVSWSLKKQKTVADSTCAAEYIAVSEAGKELIWLQALLTKLGYRPEGPSKLFCDNSVAVLLCADQTFHDWTKHLNVQYHWIRGHMEDGKIIVTQVATSNNIADGLTKVLPAPAFANFRNFVGVIKCK